MRFRENWNTMQIKIGAILLTAGIISLILFLVDNLRSLPMTKEGMNYVERNKQGQGDRQEELQVWIGDTKEPYTVRIHEQKYTEEELQRELAKAEVQLEKLILGDNDSLDEVRNDLNLIRSIPDTGIKVSWELDNYEVMNLQGQIQNEELSEEGCIVEMRATLSYEDTKEMYELHARVLPPRQSGVDKLMASLNMEVEKLDKSSETEKQMPLPVSINGEVLVWRYARNVRAVAVFLLGIVLAALFYVSEKQKVKETHTKREQQLALDYPKMVSRFTLFLGAGMTPRNAWNKIVTDYEQEKKRTASTEERIGEKENTERAVYEEMAYTMHEMKGGMAEGECYERFGERCGLQVYKKFGTLLSQNLKKGTKGLTELLKQEADAAFEDRKNMAKQLGEKAGTKILFPMFLMLAVVLLMIIVPAFLSMQI